MGYQPQIPLLTGGGVEGFHRQTAVDEGNDDAAVRDFLQLVNQTDVAIVYTDIYHRLTADADEIRCFFMMHELLIKIQLFVMVVTSRRRIASCRSLKVREL